MRAELGLAFAFALLAGCASIPDAPDTQALQALAPTGRLRVGLYPGSPTSIIPDPVSGNARGIAHDVGRDMARRLGIAFDPVVFQRNEEVLDAGKSGRVDLVFTNATPVRARDLDFSPTVLEVEQGYLVPKGSPIPDASAVDRAGVRVGVSRGSTSQAVLSRELKVALIVPTPNLAEATQMLASGKIDAFATNKSILHQMSDELPGSRVLEGRWGLEGFAFGIPKGRDAAIPLLRKLVAQVKSEGVVSRAAARAGVRGTAVSASN